MACCGIAMTVDCKDQSSFASYGTSTNLQRCVAETSDNKLVEPGKATGRQGL